MAARYLTRAQERDITKRIQAYNRRITELSKQKRFKDVVLPPKLDVSRELATVTSAPEKRVLETRLKNLSPEKLAIKETRKGVKITRGALEQAGRDLRRANRLSAARRKEIENLDVTVGKTVLGKVGVLHGDRVQEVAPKFRGVQDIPDKKHLEMRLKRLQEHSSRAAYAVSDERLRQNFIFAIKQEIPGYESDDIVEGIKNMPLDKFIEMYYTEPSIDFTFVYSLDQLNTKILEIERAIKRWQNQGQDGEKSGKNTTPQVGKVSKKGKK